MTVSYTLYPIIKPGAISKNTGGQLKKIFLLLLFLLTLTEYSRAQEQWYSTSVPFNRYINAVKFLGPNSILYGGGNEFNASIRAQWISYNKGLEWETSGNLPGPWLKSMAFIDTLQGFSIGDSACIIRTIDGAHTWVALPKPIQNREFNKIIYVTPKILFIVGGSIPYPGFYVPVVDTMQTIVRSIDSGRTWTVMLDRKGFWLNGISFSDALNGIAVGDKGVILKTTDGGVNWNTVSPPVVRDFKGIKMISPTIGYIVGGFDTINHCCPAPIYVDSFSTILRTSNGGSSWTVLKDDKAGILNDITFTNANTGYIVGDKATLLKTTNGGLNWNPVVIPGADPLETFLCVEFKNDKLGAIGARAGEVHLYTTSSLASAYTLSATLKDSVSATLFGGFNTHGEIGTQRFYFSTDSTLLSFRTYRPGDVKSDSLALVQADVSQLIPDTTYYYFVQIRTLAGFSNGDTLSFSTKKPKYTFQTLAAANITTHSANINGSINKLPTTATISFEYGTSPLFGNSIAAIPNTINDTFSHAITAALNNLAPNTIYYYRLKGVFNSTTYYGSILQFQTVNTLQTLPATNVSISGATLNGMVDKQAGSATISFEYGTSTSFGNQIAAVPGTVNDTFTHAVIANIGGLQPNTIYYYRLKGLQNAKTYYGTTLSFFTGDIYKTFQTLNASNITDSSVTMNGIIDKFKVPVTLSFEYGTAVNLGNEIVATPSFVNDTLLYAVTANLSGLPINSTYYYRLIARTALDTFYGDILIFHTGLDYTLFNTTDATNITNTSAQVNGIVSRLSHPVTLSFEWGPSPAFGNTITASPSSISDTLTHTISANLSGLVQDNIYYYRLKALKNGSPVYGETKQFYAGESEIPNWDFQFWEDDTIDVPKNWNFVDKDFERVPGHSGNYAIKLTRATFILNGVLGGEFVGGAPLNVGSPPDSLEAWLNYDITPGDSAGIVLLLRKNGNIIAFQICAVAGNTGGIFKRHAFKIDYLSPGTPDSAQILVTPSATLGSNKPVILTNQIIADDISFLPGHTKFRNSDFEEWFPTIVQRPLSWTSLYYFGLDTLSPTSGHVVSRVFFQAPNDYAAQVTNIPWLSNIVTNGEMSINKSLFEERRPGFKLKGKHLTLNGYYKYYPGPGGDSMAIFVNLFKDSIIGIGSLIQGDSVKEFTPFSIPITYSSVNIPDSGSISIRSSFSHAPKLGTKLIIDKLRFDGFPVASVPTFVHEVFMEEGMKVYPNPTRDQLIIENLSTGNEGCTLSLITLNGQVIRELKLEGSQKYARFQTGDLTPGTYILVLRIGNKIYNKKVIIL